MKSVARLLAATAVCLLAFAAPALAQYMYLDVNGDGVNTSADVLTTSSTGVDVYLRTNHNKDGSVAVCNTDAAELTMNSYEFFVRATGAMTLGTWTSNATLAYTGNFGDFQNTTDAYHGRSGPTLAAGDFLLGRLALSGVATGAVLNIVGASSVNQFGFTSFGTLCPGNDFDNTYKLGSDWNDVGGTATSGPVNANPVITAPATASGSENASVSVTGSASDPDAGQQVTLSQTNNAPFFTASSSNGPSATPSITLTGTPNFSQSGSYTINWTAVDNSTPAGTAAPVTTTLTIANTNRLPVITAPATASGAENASVSVTGSASDPDAEAVLLSQTNNAPFFTASSSTGPSAAPSITLTGTPSFTQAGTWTINWTANDFNPGGTSAASTALTIANTNRVPVITAPATASGPENASVSVTGSASDADAQNVTLSQTNNAPFFTASSSNGPALAPSITLTGTPSFAQSGTYTVNWTAVDANTPAGTAAPVATTVTITNVNRDPVITAPASASGPAGLSISVTGSATDPDAQNVTLSQTNNSGFFTASSSAGPSLNPSITLTGTPSGAGASTINWTATDANTPAGTSTATTSVNIGGGNANPTITAPAAVGGAENASVSVTGSASDPDAGNLVTLSQTNNAPFFTASSSAGPLAAPSITLTGTPSFTQAGTYTINWTAVDNGTPVGTATPVTTNLTIANTNRVPVITAPATATGPENASISVTGSATDADAQNVTLSQTNNAPFFTASSSAGPTAAPSITLTGTPSFAQSGTYTVNWTAVDANTPAGTATPVSTTVTITNVNRVPVITAPATASGTENSPASVTGSASDPDAQNVTLSQTNNAPFFTASSSNGPSAAPSITLSGTPNFTQSGTYTINWTAVDANTPAGTAAPVATTLTIANLNRNPSITAPASVSGATGDPISITGSATDPDAQTVTLSQTNNAPFLTGPASAGPATNPSITLGGTPSAAQTGSFTINWSAVDASSGPATATTDISIGLTNLRPVITAPATASGTENASVSVTGSATDADAGQLVTLSQTNNAPFFTASSSNGPSATPSITLTGTPSFSQSGSYTINWSAVDNFVPAGTATAVSTTLTIANVNRNPGITAPATTSGAENSAMSVTGSGSDPDADNVTLSQTNDAPFFTASSSNGPSAAPSITLSGTPNFSQSGSYTINWSAVDNTTGTASATTAVTVANTNRNPAITAPATVSGSEGAPVSITGSASDADGDNVTLSQTNNAAFLTGASSDGPSLAPSITLSGTPGTSDAGSYTINWSAADATTGTAAATTALNIGNQNNPPTLDQPADMNVDEGQTATQDLVGSDPDGDPLTYSKVGTTPLFMSVSAAGRVTLAPGFTDAGSFTGTVRVSDGSANDTKSFGITVQNVNRCPVADAGGPYTGIINIPVNLDGRGSSDGDGDALSYTWDFGDGVSLVNGAAPSHIYSSVGTFNVSLVVDDGTCQATATTTATIVSEFPAHAFTTGGNNTTSLGSGKPVTCVQIEPVDGSFALSDVDLSTIKMISSGTGSVSEILAITGKTTVDGDKNSNGVSEIRACFSKADLRLLFSGLPAGRNSVTVTIEGAITTGGKFRGTLTTTVKSSGSALAANISPNPLNPETTLSFQTKSAGRVTVKIYDLNGRLVKTLLDETRGAGFQDMKWNGTSDNGMKVASGIYFFRLDTPNGRETMAATVLK